MSKYKEESDKMKHALELEWSPIAITFSDNPCSEGGMDKQAGFCKVLESVLHQNTIFNLSKENTSCIGAKHYLGLNKITLSAGKTIWTDFHKGFESRKVIGKQLMKNPKPPGFFPWTKKKQKPFVVVAPLEKVHKDPNVVLVFCNARQADRITGLIAYSGHGPMPFYPANSICFAAVLPYMTGRTTLSFLSQHAHETFNVKIPSTALFISTLYNEYEKAVRNIPLSGYGTAETKKLNVKAMNELVKGK